MSGKHSSPPILAECLQSPGEDAWIEVIEKMDEMYSDLLHYEVALNQVQNASCDATGEGQPRLTISYDIAERHGGCLAATNAPAGAVIT